MNPIRPQPVASPPVAPPDFDDVQIAVNDYEMGIRATCLEQAIRATGNDYAFAEFERANQIIVARAIVFEHYIKTGELISIPAEQEGQQ